jgi:hypothetical protein
MVESRKAINFVYLETRSSGSFLSNSSLIATNFEEINITAIYDVLQYSMASRTKRDLPSFASLEIM